MFEAVFQKTARSRNEKLGSQVYSPRRIADRKRGVTYVNSRFERVQHSIINYASVRAIAERFVELYRNNETSSAYNLVAELLDEVDNVNKLKLQWRNGGICDTLYQDVYGYLKVSSRRVF